jgi:hypothetical protein
MRARHLEPGGSSCTRCAAVLRPGAASCTLCGWPLNQDLTPTAQAVEDGDNLPTPADEEELPGPTDEVEVEPTRLSQDQSHDHGGSDTARPVDRLPAADPLTAPLSLLTVNRTGMPGPMLADELAEGSTGTATIPTSQIVLDPLWDMVPAPELDESDPTESQVPALRPTIRLAWLTTGSVVAVSVLAVTVPILAWAADAVDLMAASAPAGMSVAAGLMVLATLVFSVVVFLAWVSTARANVDQLSPVPQRWSPTVARAGWLVPVAGLFIGWQVLRDLWAASDPATRAEASVRKPEPLLVTSWLAGLAVSSVVSLAGRFVLGGSPLVDAVAGAAVAVAGGCLVLIVLRISRWQDSSSTPPTDGPGAA